MGLAGIGIIRRGPGVREITASEESAREGVVCGGYAQGNSSLGIVKRPLVRGAIPECYRSKRDDRIVAGGRLAAFAHYEVRPSRSSFSGTGTVLCAAGASGAAVAAVAGPGLLVLFDHARLSAAAALWTDTEAR